jgi:prepilin-type N-terminal cleavage/methylation domain-containing protein/prepilin-type processing-associated H-X9-DG protein
MRHRSRNHAFTLVELLVVIAIIGILIGLLLPAVQMAREAARRTHCSNNLKQIGLALQNYHDSYESFPPGYLLSTGGSAPPTGDDYSQWGWGAMILPFMEQRPLYDAIDVGDTPLPYALEVPASLSAMQQPLSAYRCPSDTGPDLQSGVRYLWDTQSQQVYTATSNYVAAHASWGGNNTNHRYASPLTPNEKDEVGAFQEGRGCSFAAIMDGSSNTIAVGERRWEYKDSVNGGTDTARAALIYGIQRPNNAPDRGDQVAHGRVKLNYTAGTPNRARQGFSSMHPGGAMFVFCDGSTHFLSDNIEYGPDTDGDQWADDRDTNTIYERLIARRDGQPVGNYGG